MDICEALPYRSKCWTSITHNVHWDEFFYQQFNKKPTHVDMEKGSTVSSVTVCTHTHTHTKSVRTDGGEGQFCLTEILRKRI